MFLCYMCKPGGDWLDEAMALLSCECCGRKKQWCLYVG
jgi:hypothetical protein